MATIMDTLTTEKELQEEAYKVSDNLVEWGATSSDKALGAFLGKADTEMQQIIKDAKPHLWDRWNCEIDENGRLA